MEKRTFEDYEASTSKEPRALLVGITSPSSGGKTYSALRLATGIVRVTGGEIYGIDTESKRMLHYKDRFKFRHVPFFPPFNPLSYASAIDHCLAKGAKVIIVDSMTHEHSGEGGVLDAIDNYLIEKVARKRDNESEYDVRERYKWSAQIAPKAERRKLNNKITSIGAKAIFIFCYRADDKTKPVAGGKPIHLGWQAETTSKLPYEMTVRFLLPPASDGKPNLNPDTEFEKLSIKMPEDFRNWFKPGLQLNEELGERLANWSYDGVKLSPGADIIARLAKIGVTQDRALSLVNRATVDELTAEDIGILTGKGKAIKDKTLTIDAAFPAQETK